jgi:inhibitor of growth protein 3
VSIRLRDILNTFTWFGALGVSTPLTIMPRDDLSIDFIGRRGDMVQQEHQDAAAVLDEWVNRSANLPAEIAFMQEEIEEKDRQMSECLAIITKNDNAIQKWIRANGSHTPNPKEESMSRIILENFDKARILQDEKVALAKKTQQIMDKHTRWLDNHIKTLQDRGELSHDPDLPSLLRPRVPDRVAPRIDQSATAMPLSQISNSASMVHARHPNQHPARVLPGHIQSHQMSNATSTSAPATPTASMLIAQRVRESSLGAAQKRQRLTGGLGVLPSSSLARQSSMTPVTPRGGTPTTAARAGSAGPRASHKSTIKKAAPNGSRQSGAPRKPKKSGLSRLKRPGNKNSPSSTNDSELSEAESASADEDEAATPPARKDHDGDEEMGDVDDEEGGDDKKYCVCQSVSYGDMVACDNDDCPLEWFHWNCVGLKSEPVGTWICPVCTSKGVANKK